MDDLRKEFEVWYKSVSHAPEYVCFMMVGNLYLDRGVQVAWLAWQESKSRVISNSQVFVQRDLLVRCLGYAIIAQCHPCISDISFNAIDEDIHLVEKILEENNGE